MHWATRARLVRKLRTHSAYCGIEKAVKFEVPVDIIVQPFTTTKVMADADGYHPAVKAVIDGLVDAKVIENDSPQFLKSIKYLTPIKGEISGMKVWISYIEGDE